MGQTKIRNSQIVGDGWIEAEETWTYASATTFTISGDKTDKYQKGDKIKMTQTDGVTFDHFYYVLSVAYSSPNTTVTVTAGVDYTIHNSAISNPCYSRVENPSDFPHWFDYTPSIGEAGAGSISSTSIGTAKFMITGNTCYLTIYFSTTVTGTVSYITMTPPITMNETAFQVCNVGDCGGVAGRVLPLSTSSIYIAPFSGNVATGSIEVRLMYRYQI